MIVLAICPVAFAGPAPGAESALQPASAGAREVADWATASGDHGELPFAVVDKLNSRVHVFDAAGRLQGSAPALLGSASGDHSVPGIGERKLSAIRPEERTTAAGRFVAAMGKGPKGDEILWVDYEAGLALHRVVTTVTAERRLQRLAGTVIADRRITYGCINVPAAFFEQVVAPAFRAGGGVVYVLPESGRVREFFKFDPAVPAQPPALSTGGGLSLGMSESSRSNSSLTTR